MLPAGSSIGTSACPLCSSGMVRDHCRDQRRSFFRCDDCGLVFVPSSQFLSPEDERKRYDLHRNSPDDEGYRLFLHRMFLHLQVGLSPASSGLDFGSGTGQVLAQMFREAGHSMATYDPFYEPDRAVLRQQYDFITATEVVEHLRDPKRDLELLWACLRPGGYLGIMTRPAVDMAAFPMWHYKNDLTHVCFFSSQTFRWLADTWGSGVAYPESDIVLFRKQDG